MAKSPTEIVHAREVIKSRRLKRERMLPLIAEIMNELTVEQKQTALLVFIKYQKKTGLLADASQENLSVSGLKAHLYRKHKVRFK